MDFYGLDFTEEMTLKYDSNPDNDTANCLYHCPRCNSTFFGGGRACHHPACEAEGYKGCEMLITPAFLAAVKQKAAVCGDDSPHWGVSLNLLRKHLPELVEGSGTQ